MTNILNLVKGGELILATEEKKQSWAKNFGKSVAYSAKITTKRIMPTTASTMDSVTESLREVRSLGNRFNSINRQQKTQLSKTKLGRSAKQIFDTAMSDLKSGKFARETVDDLFDEFNDDIADDFDLNFDLDDDEIAKKSPEEIILGGTQGVAKSVIASGSAQLQGLESLGRTLTMGNVQTSKAVADSINNATLYGANLLNTTLISMNSKLDSINDNIAQLVDFNGTTLADSMSVMGEYFDRTSEMMNQIGEMFSSMYDYQYGKQKDRKGFDTSNGFNIKEYLNYAKDAFKNSAVGSMGSMLVGGVLDDYKKDPIGTIVSKAMESLIPKNVKQSLTHLDRDLPKYFDEALKRFGDYLPKDSGLSMIWSLLGISELGNKRSTAGRPDMGAYHKDAMLWNGYAQRALVEVIPEYLSSIDNTVTNLDRMLSETYEKKNANHYSGDKRYYDYDEGKFKSRRSLEEDYFDTRDTNYKATGKAIDRLLEYFEGSEEQKNKKIANINRIYNQRITDPYMYSQKEFMADMSKELDYMKKNGTKAYRLAMMNLINTIESGNSEMEEFYQQIGSSGSSVYKNLFNEVGKESYHKHSNIYDHRYDSSTEIDLFELSRLTIDGDLTRYIAAKINQLGLHEKIAEDRSLLDKVNKLRKEPGNDKKIDDLLIKESSKLRAEDAKTGLIGKVKKKTGFDRLQKGIENRGQRYADTIHEFDDRLYGKFYNDDLEYHGYDEEKVSSRQMQTGSTGSASSFKTSGKGAVNTGQNIRHLNNVANGKKTTVRRGPSLSEKARDEAIKSVSTGSAETIMNRTDQQVSQSAAFMNKAGNQIMLLPEASTVEDAIRDNSNAQTTMLASMLQTFNNTNSKLFGAHGILSTFWDSDTAKSIKEKIEYNFFDEENGVFGDKITKLKDKARNFWESTKDQLANGYDFVYRNTMTYLYGEDYKDNENYQKYMSWLDFKGKRDAKKQALLGDSSEEGKDETTKTTETSSQKKSSIRVGPEFNDKVTPVEDKKKSYLALPAPEDPIKKLSPTALAIANSDEPVDEAKKHMALTIYQGSLQVQKAVDDVAEDLGGDTDAIKKASDEGKTSFWDKVKKIAPKAAAAAIAGGIFGAIASPKNLGIVGSAFLPTGIVGGAIAASGLMILSHTEAFQSLLFGKKDDKTGKRFGGLFNEKMQATFKKALPFVVGGATLGALKSLVLPNFAAGTTFGLVTSTLFPSGVIGGALLGAGLGILKNSEKVNSTLFGEKDEDGKRSGKFLSNAYNKAKGGLTKLFPSISKGLKGAAIGGLSAVTLSNLGFLPAMLSVGGPIGWGIMGMGIGLASSTKKFNEMLFGTDILDSEGNPTGKKTTGLLTRTMNILKVNVIDPIAQSFHDNMINLVDWTKDKITLPFRMAFGPILDGILGIKDNITDWVREKINLVGDGISRTLKAALKKIFRPITSFIGKVGGVMLKTVTTSLKATLTPAAIALKVLELGTMGKRRKEYMSFYRSYMNNLDPALEGKWDDYEAENGKKRGFFGRKYDQFQAITAPLFGNSDIYDEAKASYNETLDTMGKDHLKWREGAEDKKALKAERKQHKKDRKLWNRVDKIRHSIVNDDLHGNEFDLNEMQVRRYQAMFAKAGLDKDRLQTSDDIMDLLYRKGEWQKGGSLQAKIAKDGIKIDESAEAKAAREQTEKYQNETKEYLRDIRDRMEGEALKHAVKFKDIDSEEARNKYAAKIARRAKKKGIDINKYDFAAMGYADINLMDDETLDEYLRSDEYANNNFSGFVKRKQKERDAQNASEDAKMRSDRLNRVINERKINSMDLFTSIFNEDGSIIDGIQFEGLKRKGEEETGATLSTKQVSAMYKRAAKKAGSAFDQEEFFKNTFGDNYSDKFRQSIVTPKGGLAGTDNETLKKIIDLIIEGNRLADETKELTKEGNDITQTVADTASVQVEVATGGAANAEEIAKQRKKTTRKGFFKLFSKRDADQYNITQQESETGFVKGLLNFVGVKKKKDKEEAEDEKVRSGAHALVPYKANELTTTEEKEEDQGISMLKSLVGKAFGGILSLGQTPIGSTILKWVKRGGILYGTSAFMIGLMELIKPGFQDNLVNSVQTFAMHVENADYYNDFVKPLLQKVIDKVTEGLNLVVNDFPLIWDKYIVPAMDSGLKFVTNHAEKVVPAITKVLTTLIPPFVDAFVKVVPTIAKSLIGSIWNATVAKIFPNAYWDWNKEDNVGKGGVVNIDLSDSTDAEVAAKKAEMEELGYTYGYNSKTRQLYYSDSTRAVSVDENGNAEFVGNQNAQRTVENSALRGAVNIAQNGKIGKTIFRGAGGALGGLIGAAGGYTMPLVSAHAGASTGAAVGSAAGGIAGDAAGGIAKNIFGDFLNKTVVMGSTGQDIAAKFISKMDPSDLEQVVKLASSNAMEGLTGTAAEKASGEAAQAVLEKYVKQGIVNTASDEARRITPQMLEALTKSTSEALLSTATGTEATTEWAKNIASKAAKYTAETAPDAVKEAKTGVINKFLNLFKNFANKLKNSTAVKKVLEKTGQAGILSKIINAFISFGETAVGKILKSPFKLISKVATKISDALAKIGLTSSPLGVVFGIYDITTGLFASDAANLFHVDQDSVDWKMRLISSLFKTITGLSFGLLLDIALEIMSLVTGEDWKCKLATDLYNLIADDDDEAKLEAAQANLAAEAEENGMDVDAYSDMVNKTFGQKVWSGVKSGASAVVNGIKSLFGGSTESEGSGNVNTSANLTKMTGVTDSQLESMGFGRLHSGSVGYGDTYSQGNSKWGNVPLGTLPDGSPSNMKEGGCGPTSLAIVASQLSGGVVDPGTIGKFAANNGYISQGGANAGLFTEGASQLGLNPRQLSKGADVVDSLMSGSPTIISGVGNHTSDPFTKDGHIVVASGIDSMGNVVVNDPLDGKVKTYGIKDVVNKATGSWSYGYGRPMGYGAVLGLVGGYFGKKAIDFTIKNAYTVTDDNGVHGVEYENSNDLIYSLRAELLKTAEELLGKLFTKLKSSSIMVKLASNFTNNKEAMPKLLDRMWAVIEKFFKYIRGDKKLLIQLTADLQQKLMKSALTTTPIAALTILTDLASGAYEAGRLFLVDSNSVDTPMRLISAVFKALLGSGPGPILEWVLGAMSIVYKKDYKTTLATELYNTIADAINQQELKESLANAQAELIANASDYNNTNTENKTISVKSYARKENKSLISTIYSGIKNIGKSVLNFVIGSHNKTSTIGFGSPLGYGVVGIPDWLKNIGSTRTWKKTDGNNAKPASTTKAATSTATKKIDTSKLTFAEGVTSGYLNSSGEITSTVNGITYTELNAQNGHSKLTDVALAQLLSGMRATNEVAYNSYYDSAEKIIKARYSAKSSAFKSRYINEYIFKRFKSAKSSTTSTTGSNFDAVANSNTEITTTSDDMDSSGVSIDHSKEGVLAYLASKKGSSGLFGTLGLLGTVFTNYFNAKISGEDPWSKIADALEGNENNSSSSSADSNSDYSNITIAGSNNEEKIWNFFKSLGTYSDSAIAGIMGNMYAESGLNPAAIQNNGAGPAAGIVQWENYNTKSKRWKYMNDYAQSKGKQWTDLQSQLEYVDKEITDGSLNTYFKRNTNTTLSAWKTNSGTSTADIKQSTWDFEHAYERGKESSLNMDKRYAAALTYYNKFSKAAGYGIPMGYGRLKRRTSSNGKTLIPMRRVVGYGADSIGSGLNSISSSFLTALSGIPAFAELASAMNESDDSSSDSSSSSSGITVGASTSVVANNARDYEQKALGGVRISSPFGYRYHPITGKYKMHNGIDFAASGGTPIYSPVSGTVARSEDGYNGGYGNLVVVQDSKGYKHYFAHQSKRAVSKGSKVAAGARVGYVGTTGASTGNHLHYGVMRPDGNYMNPASYSLSSSAGYGVLPNHKNNYTKIKDISSVNMRKQFDINPRTGYYGEGGASSVNTNGVQYVSNNNGGVEARLDNLTNIVSDWYQNSKESNKSNISVVNSGNTNVTGGTTMTAQKPTNTNNKIKNDKLQQLHNVLAAI